MSQRPQRCETCRAWSPDDGSTCHRHPPLAVSVEGDEDHEGRYLSTMWPSVVDDDWCCDWLPVEEPR